MGTDKAALVVDGISMLDRVLRAVAGAGITNVVISGPGHIEDEVPLHGPMAGIIAAWQHMQREANNNCEPVVVLSCDLPLLSPDVVRSLVDASRTHRYGAVAHDGVRPQPLVAAYRPLALDAMVEAFTLGERSVRRCTTTWNLAEVACPPEQVSDADLPTDLHGFVVDWPA